MQTNAQGGTQTHKAGRRGLGSAFRGSDLPVEVELGLQLLDHGNGVLKNGVLVKLGLGACAHIHPSKRRRRPPRRHRAAPIAALHAALHDHASCTITIQTASLTPMRRGRAIWVAEPHEPNDPLAYPMHRGSKCNKRHIGRHDCGHTHAKSRIHPHQPTLARSHARTQARTR